MERRKFISIAGASIALAGTAGYWLSDRHNVVRANIQNPDTARNHLKADELGILYLASLAPSGHNTQPWGVRYLEPYHWIISNDKSRWLPAVDPNQRETILSIGAFLQNLDYAAAHFGYQFSYRLLASSNQDDNVAEVFLKKGGKSGLFDPEKIRRRRTVRSNYLSAPIQQKDWDFITADNKPYFYFIPSTTREFQWLNEQTIEANRQQTFRDEAQLELGDWMRFSSKDARSHCDGLTTASMELAGVSSWVLRNFYSKSDVMRTSFRQHGIDQIRKQVNQSGGWLLLTSTDNSTAELLKTGQRLQQMLLRIRERNIAIHPMTQILEEAPFNNSLNASVGISGSIQFILRTGYLEKYPDPVSLRRPVEKFVVL